MWGSESWALHRCKQWTLDADPNHQFFDLFHELCKHLIKGSNLNNKKTVRLPVSVKNWWRCTLAYQMTLRQTSFTVYWDNQEEAKSTRCWLRSGGGRNWKSKFSGLHSGLTISVRWLYRLHPSRSILNGNSEKRAANRNIRKQCYVQSAAKENQDASHDYGAEQHLSFIRRGIPIKVLIGISEMHRRSISERLDLLRIVQVERMART